MDKAEKIATFDPNSPGDPNANIFGLPFTCAESEVVIIPVPWDVTVSYKDGAANGPAAVFDASLQVDLFEPVIPNAWQLGMAMDEIPEDVRSRAGLLRVEAKTYINAITEGVDPAKDFSVAKMRDTVNEGSAWLNNRVKERSLHWLKQGKLVALLGGDHSTPLGLMHALAEMHGPYGILQIDAHADLRKAYEGFTWSHASIMYNALAEIPQISKLVQIGIRDFCQEEAVYIVEQKARVATLFDRDIRHQQYNGKTWSEQVTETLLQLPEKVYISFDIDGLDPRLCPHTGTPVPGGLEFEQAAYLIQRVAQSGKKIIGMDLNEVAPGPDGDEWDANVGARMLYRMCNLMALSNGKFS
ncbi:MAG TPA: agmatinase family protein [Bacteroidia bacterium]|nr:agmatinase family protein [Bacteroidia bacterium]